MSYLVREVPFNLLLVMIDDPSPLLTKNIVRDDSRFNIKSYEISLN